MENPTQSKRASERAPCLAQSREKEKKTAVEYPNVQEPDPRMCDFRQYSNTYHCEGMYHVLYTVYKHGIDLM